MENRFKSHIRIFYLSWLIILIFLIAINTFFSRFMNLFWIYFVITWIPVMLINYYEGRRLMNYVRHSNKEEHMRMKSLNGIEGFHNGFGAVGFIFSAEDYDDNVLVMLKSDYKKVISFLLVVFFSYPFLFLLLR